MEQSEAIYGHTFNLIPDVGALRLEKLLLAFNSFEAAWNASAKKIEEETHDRELAKILDGRKEIDPQKEWDKFIKLGIEIITTKDPLYPPLLREIAHPPSLIYIKGKFQKIRPEEKFVAIVGTRRPTAYGREATRSLIKEIAKENITIVSGLAFGIDAEAHRASLEAGGRTWAVLGSGLERIYPRLNLPLANAIIEKGGLLISEYPPFEKAAPWTFPQRNRIIAGLSQATIVIEAPLKSGALITSRFAIDSNRDVGAVPGEIFSVNSQGANLLLSLGAAPIRSSNDILELIGVKAASLAALDTFDEIEERILKELGLKENQAIETILVKTGIPLPTLNQKLSLLEIRGIIKNEGGKFYKI